MRKVVKIGWKTSIFTLDENFLSLHCKDIRLITAVKTALFALQSAQLCKKC